VNAKFCSGTLKFKVPHSAENAAIVAFRSGKLNDLLPPETAVADVRTAPNESGSAEVTIIVELKHKR
jgi:hypothetical protein